MVYSRLSKIIELKMLDFLKGRQYIFHYKKYPNVKAARKKSTLDTA